MDKKYEVKGVETDWESSTVSVTFTPAEDDSDPDVSITMDSKQYDIMHKQIVDLQERMLMRRLGF